MFTIEPFFTIRQELVHKYQEQGDDLEVIFRCTDGEQRCSRAVLNYNSRFFYEQLNGRENMGNPPVFTYDFSKGTIRAFLDAMHGLKIDLTDIAELMELMTFLSYEGKKDSEFEGELVIKLCAKLKTANLSIDTKLLVGVIANDIDGLHKMLFETESYSNIGVRVMDLNLESEPNNQLKKMITKEEGDDTNDEVTVQACRLALKLKQNNTPKVGAVVKVHLRGLNSVWTFDLEVRTFQTVNQLIDQLCAKRRERGIPDVPIKSVTYKGKTLDGSLAKYNLQDGDEIIYTEA